MIKTVLLVVIVVVLGLKIISIRQEGFNQAEIERLRGRVNRISDRLRNYEDMSSQLMVISNNMNTFNLDVMNAAIVKLEQKLEREDSRILERVKKLEEQDSKHHEEVFKLNDKLHEKERSDYEKLKKHVDKLVQALGKIEKQELSDFKKIRNDLTKFSDKDSSKSKYIYVGLGLISFLLLLILVAK